MPATSEKQRKFMGAELQRKREGKPTKTGIKESQLRDFAATPVARDHTGGQVLKKLAGH